jgi:hypothetical protein
MGQVLRVLGPLSGHLSHLISSTALLRPPFKVTERRAASRSQAASPTHSSNLLCFLLYLCQRLESLKLGRFDFGAKGNGRTDEDYEGGPGRPRMNPTDLTMEVVCDAE